MKELFEKQKKDSFSDDYEAGYENFKNHFENYAEENGHELALKVAMDMSFRDDESEFSMGFNNAIIDITGRTHEMSDTQNPLEQFQEDPYLMGKFAALQDLAEMIDEGASYNDCLQAVQGTLNRELEKEASEYTDYESAVELGIESACFTFLKEASEFMADYEIAGADENEVALAIFEAAADEFEKSASLRKEAKDGKLAPTNEGALIPPGAMVRREKKGLGTGAKALLAAGGTAGTAAAAYGAKKLYDKYKKNDGKKQEKKAELNEVQQALSILEANGYNIEVGE